MNKYVKIKSIVYETKDALTIKFEDDPILSSYKSGQFTNVFVNINGVEVSRSYSFSSSPKMEELPAITIKRVNDGLVSNFLYKNINIKKDLLISEPSGRFETQNFGQKLKVFIAGGSGITPIFSMIKTVLAESDDDVLLIYANQNIESVIFKSKLSELTEQHKGRFDIIHFLEELPAEQTKLKTEKGRVDRGRLEKLLKDKPEVDSFYLCGPPLMMESISHYLNEMNVESQRIVTENFNSGPKDYSENSAETAQSTLNIFLDGNSINVKVDKSKTILQSALEQGVKLPHSCRESLCGTCKIKLLKGKVNMVENYAITNTEVDNGMILLCSSLPVSDFIEMAY